MSNKHTLMKERVNCVVQMNRVIIVLIEAPGLKKFHSNFDDLVVLLFSCL